VKIYRLMLVAMHKLSEVAVLEDAHEITDDRARQARRAIWNTVGYDVHLGFVIAAEGERQARLLAQAEADKYLEYERGRWIDPKQSACECIGKARPGTKESVILDSFRSG
jgi:hypothetical protein